MPKDISRAVSQWNAINVPGLNIRSLGFHNDRFKILLETMAGKHETLTITESYLTGNDPLEGHDFDQCQ